MSLRNTGMMMLMVGACVALAVAAAPLAAADTCDPAVTVCDGPNVSDGPSEAAPPVMASSGDQYPFDDDWYFNPAGGGTELQPNHSSGGGSSGGGGGGGHH